MDTSLWDDGGNDGIRKSTLARSCRNSRPTFLTLSRYSEVCCICTLCERAITLRTTLVVES